MTTLGKKPFENTAVKAENVGNQHFLFFPTMFFFLPHQRQAKSFQQHLIYVFRCFRIGTVQIFPIGKKLSMYSVLIDKIKVNLYVKKCFNRLPNDKILALSKLKALADDKLNVAKIMISVSYWVENIVGKGENAGYQHFLLFPQCFQKVSPLASLKVGIVW